MPFAGELGRRAVVASTIEQGVAETDQRLAALLGRPVARSAFNEATAGGTVMVWLRASHAASFNVSPFGSAIKSRPNDDLLTPRRPAWPAGGQTFHGHTSDASTA